MENNMMRVWWAFYYDTYYPCMDEGYITLNVSDAELFIHDVLGKLNEDDEILPIKTLSIEQAKSALWHLKRKKDYLEQNSDGAFAFVNVGDKEISNRHLNTVARTLKSWL
jgi:hypothetical protein